MRCACSSGSGGTGATVEAVAGVDLAVAEGEIFGLLGPNGAGKPVTGLRRSLLSCAWRKVMPHGLRASRS